MRKKLPLSILGTICLIFLISVLSVFFINYLFKNEVIQQQQEKLLREAEIILAQTNHQDMVDSNDETQKIVSQLDTIVRSTNERITLLDENGIILYDTSSNSDKEVGGDRSNRPEVQAVLNGAHYGTALRKSPTFNEDFLYVAFPIKQDGKKIGILRISEKFEGLSGTIRSLRFFLIIFIGILFFVLMILLSLLLRQKNEPFKTLLPVLKTMKENPENQKNIIQNSSDWQELYDTVNELTQEFSKTYQIYTSNEERFNLLLKDLMIGIFMIDYDQRVTMMNPKMLELLHIETPPKFPTPYLQVLHHLQLTDLIQRSFTEGTNEHQEIVLHIGGDKILDLTLKRLNSDENQPIQLIGIAYDLTDIRNLETMQKDFVSNVSHELKTPVTSLIGFTETLLDGGMYDANTLEEFLKIIQKEAFRLEALIQDILQLSKGENTSLDHNPKTWYALQSANEILASYPSLITNKRLKITKKIDPELTLFINETLISAILKNLVENAIQYSGQDGTILISIQKSGSQLLIKVQDNGLGISEDDQIRIFERFYRVDKARSRNSGGTGLGLAIVAHYVTILNGSIDLDSHLGYGTTFTVTIPMGGS